MKKYLADNESHRPHHHPPFSKYLFVWMNTKVAAKKLEFVVHICRAQGFFTLYPRSSIFDSFFRYAYFRDESSVKKNLHQQPNGETRRFGSVDKEDILWLRCSPAILIIYHAKQGMQDLKRKRKNLGNTRIMIERKEVKVDFFGRFLSTALLKTPRWKKRKWED